MTASRAPSRLLIFAAAAASFLAGAFATLSIQGEGNIVCLNVHGSCSATVYVVSDTPEESLSVSSSSLYEVASITPSTVSGGTNFTVVLDMDNGVGTSAITFTAGDASVSSTVIVAGFDLLDSDGKVVSGDQNSATVGQSGSYTYTVRAIGPDGASIDVSSTAISFRSPKDPYMKEVDESATKFSGDSFILALNNYRIGDGVFYIDFLSSDISYDGEVFETVLVVNQDTSNPPCVVIAGAYDIVDGKVELPMYNLLSPPRTSDVSTVTLTVDGKSAAWDQAASTLTNPDQKVVFVAPGTGSASVSCDGADAKIVGGDSVTISGDVAPTTSGPLAQELVQDLDKKSGYSQFLAELVVKNSSVATLSAAAATGILDKFCAVISGNGCALTGLVDGSAVCTMSGNVKPDAVEGAQNDLQKSFDDCSFPTSLGYPCDGGPDDLALGDVKVNAVGAPAVTAAGGMATWLVVLVAGVGALAVISLLMVGLLAVYRRSAEQSESDYSSSGPLGVPDPSDLLYEQSIVRDIYGRGDFPDGGPSAQVAADRERQAELREEVPRPPSSNSLSSRASEISSTYSV